MAETWEQRVRRGGWAEDRMLFEAQGRVSPIGPWNTYSNAAYAVVGGVLAWAYQDAASAAMAVALMFLATGSALYHGYKTIEANRLDWLGMFAVFGALATHGWLPAAAPATSWIMLGVSVVLGWTYLIATRQRKDGSWPRQLSFDWAMGVLLLASSLPVALRGGWLLLGASWGLFALAMACWQLDKRRSMFTGRYGHALWHVGTAVAFGVLYLAQGAP